MRNTLILILLLFAGSLSAQKAFYNVLDYGAVPDGKTLNTEAINKAVNRCADNGGGTVIFPAGTYLTGTIQMQDNVLLHLEAGSTILGSKNIEDYRVNKKLISNNKQDDINGALILSIGRKNTGITGFGVIDGQGNSFYGKDNRPVLLFFNRCKDVTVEGVTLQHPPAWTQHYMKCNGVTIRDIKVFAHGGENNDMVDINQSRNVVITGLNGDSDDDGITLKSTAEGLVKKVAISDCHIRTRTNAIKMGTESYGGFRDIAITNCTISPSVTKTGFSGADEGLAGIALEIVDGGIMENIAISNIVMEGTTSPIFIRLGNRARNYPELGLESKPVGSINNVKISNIIARNASKTGCSIVGEIGHPIRNVTISNVKINFKGGGTLWEGLAEKPELINEYPECVRLGTLPAYGFFVRHVDGITFRDLEFTYDKEEHRPAMLFNDVHNLKIFNFDAQISDDARGKIVLQNSSNVFINGCSPVPARRFLQIEKQSRDIFITGNNLSTIQKPISIDETIKTSDLHIEQNLTGNTNLFGILQPNIRRDSLGKVTIYYPDSADIYYTTDGSTPTDKSLRYTEPFEQIGTCTIKAIAIDGKRTSGTAVEQFPTLNVLTPAITPKDQFFHKKIKVTLTSKTPGANIYYTLDGSKPDKNAMLYKKPVVITQDVQLRAIAIKEGYKPSSEASSKFKTIEKKPGVQYKYYKGRWTHLPEFIELTPARSGITNKFSLDGIKTTDIYFGLVMHAFVNIKNAGEYTFFLISNDGSKLLIDHRELIDNDGAHGSVEETGKTNLSKGIHLIEVRYFQAGGGKNLKLFWQGPGFEKKEITKDDLK